MYFNDKFLQYNLQIPHFISCKVAPGAPTQTATIAQQSGTQSTDRSTFYVADTRLLIFPSFLRKLITEQRLGF